MPAKPKVKFKLPKMIRVRHIAPTGLNFIHGKTYWMTHFDSNGFCDIKGKETFPDHCEWWISRFEPLPLTNQDKKESHNAED